MKHLFPIRRSSLGAILTFLAVAFLEPIQSAWAQANANAAAPPAITAIRVESTNVVVTVRVPAGLRRVTLEARERLGRGAWEPRSVARLDGTGGSITFRLPRSRALEMMRVRADVTDPLPSAFYTGATEFEEVAGASRNPTGAFPGANLDSQNTAQAQEPREVVESDIWKIRGQTLYFFNQLRGLQAIDLANPDAPRLRGTLELPAVGEEMYTLGDHHVVLLARNGCSYSESEVIIAADRGAAPTITARLPVSGYLQESRLVGSALYLATSSYRQSPATNSNGVVWEAGTLVSGFDLSNPEAPVARNSLWFPGSVLAVTATDRLLFVVLVDPANWWQSTIQSVDITSPDGTLSRYETIRTAGRVPDKFKIQWADGILTTVSEDWRATGNRRVTTLIESFRLPDPRSAGPIGVAKLNQLEVGRGEQLHATRFDGRRLYVVTFFRIDPLFVIDLSNPSALRVAGSVDVPGWSTYIRPMGDRLVTIGIETNRVAVSLFNVSNPAAPVLTDRVRLGDHYSWSEANWDEQAFSVLPEAGLILVPYSGDTTNGYTSKVQLIDFNRSSLTARGVIEHQFQPRRATLYSDRVLSLSGWELLSVDATDRDHPQVRSNLALAWPVDRVFLAGDYLVELGGAGNRGWWSSTERPTLKIAAAGSPNSILSETGLKPLSIVGATVRASVLYLAQGTPFSGFFPVPLADANGAAPADGKLLLTTFDLSALPSVRKLGETEVALAGGSLSGDVQALWPKSDLLVLVGGASYGWWDCLACVGPGVPVAANVAADAMGAQLIRPWPMASGGGRLIAFDVREPEAPRFVSDVDLGTNGWWNFSAAATANGMVYLSHQLSFFIEDPVPIDPDPIDRLVAPIIWPGGSWIAKSYLDVVDYADPSQPLVRRPVNIPGKLNGVSADGALLFTVGARATKLDANGAWTEYLDASAYDGVTAHLIDSLTLPFAWPHPVLVSSGNIYIGWPDYGANTPATAAHSVQAWSVSDAGKFTRLSRTPISNPANSIAAFGDLLAVQQSDNTLTLLDVTHPAAPSRVGNGRPAGCQWYDLTHADGRLESGSALNGLWLPLGAYGVARVATAP